jgi:Tc toxin complex TcA C-terminal TcB-binding domain/Neuraminidase-like domain/Salmonella virulence plasmid 28.1kDa A protein
MVNPQPTRTVSGQVLRTNNTPFGEPGFTVRAFDAISASNIVALGNPIPLQTNGSYRISYTWQSTGGRKSPNLLVRVFNPQGTSVGEATKPFAGMQENLNVTVNVPPPPPPPQNYLVKGTVRQSNGVALAGAIVHADNVKSGSDRLGTTKTNNSGQYEIRYTLASGASNPDLIVSVYNEQEQQLAVSPRKNNAQLEETIDLTVILPEPEPQFVVKGHIYQADGLALAGIIVRAFDRDLRSEQLLGQQTTNSTGYYEISYTRAQFRRAEKANADLVLRLVSPTNQEIQAVTLTTGDGTPLETLTYPGSDGNPIRLSIWFNAPPVAVINATVKDERYQGLSEYDRNLNELAPLLENVSISSLTDADITFLAAETKIDAQHISYLKIANELQSQTQISAPAYYGLFRQNLPTDLALLLIREPQEWRSALKQSLADNIIPNSIEATIDAIVTQLQALLPTYVAGGISGHTDNPLAAVLSTVLPDSKLRQTFAAAYANYDGKDSDAFWQNLKTQPGFANGVAESVQFTLQANTFTQNYLPLIRVLQQEQQRGTVGAIADLARLDEAGWLRLLNTTLDGKPVGTPDYIPGATPEEKAQNYAKGLTQLSEALFPTVAIAANLERDTLPGKQDILTFLARNPEFSLEQTPFQQYLVTHPKALEGIQNPDSIAAVQRIFYVAPRFELMKPLLADRLNSAFDITRLGETQFIQRYEQPLGGTAQAQLIYQQAEARTGYALALLSTHNATFNDIKPWVIPSLTLTPEALQPDKGVDPTLIPTLEVLFGSLTTCECEHCRSLYSPAAYLTDGLNFLKQANLLDDLRRRRPDIGAIELTCANTHTPLPYIDLVNEVLEQAITGGLDEAYQTTRTAAELLAAPEHITEEIYNTTLQAAVYPQELPFDLGWETARVYLKHLGSSRYEVMQLFRPEITTDLHWEKLGLSPAEGAIVVGMMAIGDIGLTLPQFYGYPSGISDSEFTSNLSQVSEFLKRSNISYRELLDLLDSTFVNPERSVNLDAPEDADCNLTLYRLENLTAAFLDRLHRFLRLRRALGWSIAELDRAIAATGSVAIDDSLLSKIAAIQQLSLTLNAPISELLNLWSTLTLSGFNEDLRLARILRLQARELPILRQLLGEPIEAGNPAITVSFIERLDAIRHSHFSIAQLSYLYLHNADAVAALEPGDEQLRAMIRTLRSRLKTQPDAPVSIPTLEDQLRAEFTADVQKIPAERITNLTSTQIEESLTFLRSNQEDTPENRVKIDTLFGEFLDRSEAYSILLGETDSQIKLAYVLELLKIFRLRQEIEHLLKQFLPDEIVSQAITFLTNAQNDTPENQAAIARFFGKFLDPSVARIELLNTGDRNPIVSTKMEYVLKQGLYYLQQRDLVIQTLADTLRLDPQITRWLIEDYLSSSANSAYPAIADFLNLPSDETASPGNETIPINLQTTFRRLHKIALLIQGFEFTVDELQYFVSSGVLNLSQLPLASPEDSSTAFQQWEQMSAFHRLRDSLPKRKTRLIEVLTTTNEEEAKTKLTETTGWTATEISSLNFSADFQNIARLKRLQQQINLSRRIGIAINQLTTWATNPPSSEQAKEIQEAVKAKYEEKQWLTIARPLEDKLREQRRIALVAYLIHRPELWLSEEIINQLNEQNRQADANMLYEHFLIDVEMSACQLTSRVRQAIAAVQLFIQRCLMGLEGSLEIAPNLSRQWETWMKTYRYWEANRKIFVYPENWIEPELRDDKSPFFKTLENALLQNDVTQETVENAFYRYLEQLNDIARLEIIGMYVEEEARIIHVFGRTSGIPHRYYYRRLISTNPTSWLSGNWTAWEKVELDIEGDHLIPVIWNRRLYLFWAIFTEKAEQDRVPEEPDNDSDCINGQPAPTDETPEQRCDRRAREREARSQQRTPNRYWEIQLAYSEYRNGQWSAKTISESSLNSSRAQNQFRRDIYQTREFYFRTMLVHDELVIIWYIQAYSEGRFTFSNCGGNCTATPDNDRLFTLHPGNLDREAMGFLEREGDTLINNSFSLFDGALETINESSFEVNLRELLLRSLEIKALVFNTTPTGIYSLVSPHQQLEFNAARLPFFYRDSQRNLFVVKDEIPKRWQATDAIVKLPTIGDSVKNTQPLRVLSGIDLEVSANSSGLSSNLQPVMRPTQTLIGFLGLTGLDSIFIPALFANTKRYIFSSFHHPYICLFIKQLNQFGIAGLLNPSPDRAGAISTESEESKLRRQRNHLEFFANDYQPNRDVVAPEYLDPVEEIDFSSNGAYSLYNWELFFHTPLLVADRLMQNQQFAEAQKWFHYIFDPTVGNDPTVDKPDPARFWKIRPFYEIANDRQTIDRLMRTLNSGNPQLIQQVTEWRNDPFNPHRIARTRITAYMKTVVMKYLDNLIAWGDNLFQQDTQETVAEATQIYILAANILGPKPPIVPPRGTPPARTFDELEPNLDKFSNALVRLEEQLPVFESNIRDGDRPILPEVLYFCIPANDKLLNYWNVVGDRLFKIRHCMNIEGIVRQLPLFEPPIDPTLLVRAKALGVDLRDVLAGGVSLSPYRFNIMLQKANELCAEVKALGAALLSAYEKRDAEALARLRSEHEIRLLDVMKEVRQKQLEEAKETKASLEISRETITERLNFYRDIEYMNAEETASLSLGTASSILGLIANGMSVGGASGSLIPDITIGIAGWAGSPMTIATTGGQQASNVAGSWAKAFEMLSGYTNILASLTGTMGSYKRRWDEWKLQERLAQKELAQIDKQIAVAEIREQIAQKELENHDRQRQNAREVDDYMRSKFTNQELYDWMVSEIAAIYFQSYQLAYETARRAEQAYRFERGLTDSNFIRFGQWDSLRRGLMSGERLQLDLRRLEMAYLNENQREFELTKHISLALLNPFALIALKETGRCFINLPEEIFDLDYPGHYFRRIKSVSLTLPCVVGLYTTISCTLRLLKNSIRINTKNGDNGYPRNTDDQGLAADDDRFIENNIPVKAIAASNAQNDSGVFELSFRDERYLPFEGAGAISQWSLELFNDNSSNFGKDLRQFDYGTISDAILHIKYTAREDAGAFKNAAVAHLRSYFSQDGATPSLRMFNLRQEFPTQWHRFLNPTNPADGNVFELEMSPSLFSLRDKDKTLKVNSIALLARCTNVGSYDVEIEPLPEESIAMTLPPVNQYGGLHFSQTGVEIDLVPTDLPVKWQFKMTRSGGGNLQEDPLKKVMEVEELLMVLGYEWEPSGGGV